LCRLPAPFQITGDDENLSDRIVISAADLEDGDERRAWSAAIRSGRAVRWITRSWICTCGCRGVAADGRARPSRRQDTLMSRPQIVDAVIHIEPPPVKLLTKDCLRVVRSARCTCALRVISWSAEPRTVSARARFYEQPLARGVVGDPVEHAGAGARPRRQQSLSRSPGDVPGLGSIRATRGHRPDVGKHFTVHVRAR
jgi:hypothetical protein